MKGKKWKLLALCLALFLSVESTIAYLSDTDSDVNVMTLGRVEIKLNEHERLDQTLSGSISDNLTSFQDNHPLLPGVYPAAAVTGDETDFWPNSVNNAIDKIVTVTNTGNSPAYVRLWFAFEVTEDKLFFDQKLHLNKNSTDWQWEFLTEADGSYTDLYLDNSHYVAAVATYSKELAVDVTTPASLRQVLMASGATNEDLAALGDKYSIFVVAQGVQAAGFDDAVTALNAGFKAPSAASHPFDNMTAEETPGYGYMVDEQALRTALTQNIPDNGGKSAVTSLSFGRLSEYARDVEELTAFSLDTAKNAKNTALRFLSMAFADEPDAPQVYYKPGKNENGTQYYDVYILYEGTIKLPNNCEGLLENYKNLNSFTTTNLDAQEVKKMENFFKGCTNLTKVTVPQGVTEIDTSMFADCSSLEKVSIPGTVERINENAFQDHKEDILFIVVQSSPAQGWVEDENLSSTVVPSTPQTQNLPFTWRNDGISITITGYTGTSDNVEIPDTIDGLPVTAIGTAAFYGNATLNSVSLPDTLEIIDCKAFLGCKNLSKITIPDSVHSLNTGAFNDCALLTSITIPENVTAIGEMVFMGCSSLTEIHVDSDNPTYASKGGVLFSKDMKTLITYPGGKKGHYDVPAGVIEIAKEAFYGCSKLTSVQLPNSLQTLGESAFRGSGISSIVIPGKVKTLPYGVFSSCNALKSITIPKSVTFIAPLPTQATIWVDSYSYACIWCKENKALYKLLDAGADHVCDLISAKHYIKEDINYHQHIYKCSGCASALEVREPHTFDANGKCLCGASNTGNEHVKCNFLPTNRYINQDLQYHYQIFCCDICFNEVSTIQNHAYNNNGICVCGATIAVEPDSDVTIIAKGTILNTNVNVRTGPSTEYAPIFSLKSGMEVEIIEIPDVIDSSHWFKIRFEGTIGYVMAPYVQVIATLDGN